MNVLEYLSQKKQDLYVHKHPFAKSAANFKYAYCFGLAVLVYGYKEQLPITIDTFSSIINDIHLDLEQQKKLPLQVKNHFDLKISEVFHLLDTKPKQYCFLADLYRLSFFGLISPTYCHDIIEGYSQVFNFSPAEHTFIKEFSTLGYQTANELKKRTLSVYDTKLDQAITLYENFKASGYYVSTSILEYIYPSFSLTNEIHDLKLNDGSIQRYESNLKIQGKIEISNCSTLVLDHAYIKIKGSFSVTNGKIIIRNSILDVEECVNDFLIYIEDTPAIRIENSTINCHNKCGFLNQKSGQLKLQNSTISNTSKDCCVYFEGNSAEISQSHFLSCKNGAVFNNAKKELFIGSCEFQDCSNIHGGAIHCRSIADTTIYNCKFDNCHAQYIGGAIYFVNLKYGQNVLHCDFSNCTPTDSVVFNSYHQKGYKDLAEES